ncbi:MAG: M14 family metallopeptidase [Pyrinomonadaceae bacterium]
MLAQSTTKSVLSKSPSPLRGQPRPRFLGGQIALLLAIIISFVLAPAPSRAQVPRTAVVPSPPAVLGFSPGDDRTIADWRQITNYFSRLDRASDRVLVQNLGTTTLQRPMIAAFISAPENIRDLAKYKSIQARLADPRKIKTQQERDQLVAEGKTVVVISCSIHSTEIVASQMSMQLAYEMATATDPNTVEILRNTILILVPAANPDGVDIVANWYRKTLGTRSEGTEPPELYHYYAGHDDNRDWFMLNLKETKSLTRLLWKEWFPQIVYDVHQQGPNGSRFFIPPFYDPPNPHIAPLLLREVGLLGHKIAADLQTAGFKGVVTNAVYDTWWHGGFRTAPYYHNSIGILSEAASARLMSPTSVTRDQLARATTRGLTSALPSSPQTNFPDPWPGGVWRPRDILALELSASRSVLSLAARYRERYLRNFYELGRTAVYAEPVAELPLGYVIHAGQGRDENVAKMIGALVEQGVEVFRLERELHATLGEQVIRRVSSVTAGNAGPNAIAGIGVRPVQNHPEVPLGSYIIFLNQPYRQNVLALFEPQVYPNRLTATGEAERPYDVAGWTLPMQMGVESLAVMSIRESANERQLTLIKSENDVRRDLGLPLSTDDRSPIVNPVKAGMRVGIYQGARGNMDEGWTRYVFDTFNVPFKTVRDAGLREANLKSNFDVIVLPSERRRADADATEDAAPSGLSVAAMESLRAFVDQGGTLICFDGSCGPTIKQLKLPLRNVLDGLRSSEFYCPGSVLRLDVDTSHPIARTMAKEVDAYFANSSAFEANDPTQVRVIARYANQEVLRSGWLLGEDRIQDKIALAEVGVGKGRVVLFGFRPQHRGQSWGTFPFIWNALTSN